MAGLSARKHLCTDALVGLVQSSFARVTDPRPGKGSIPLADALMSAFAMFALKDPSLLAFDERRHDENLLSLYRIGQVPSDTQLRAILDLVPPEAVPPPTRMCSAKCNVARPWSHSSTFKAVICYRSTAPVTFRRRKSTVLPACERSMRTAPSLIIIKCSVPPWSIQTRRK